MTDMTSSVNTKHNVLYAQYFGSFSLTYNGRLITGRSKSNENQFNYLMQLMLYRGTEGISRNQLLSSLFTGRDPENPGHAIYSIMYNAKKKLQNNGLPDVNYFVLSEGKFYWSREIPVQSDVMEFDELLKKASEADDSKTKIELLKQAIYLYTGDFLENQLSTIWIAKENWRYRRLFAGAVEELGKLLEEEKDVNELERLGKYASSVQPFSNWETLTMKALVSKGEIDKAYRLFENTSEQYLFSQGIKPDEKMYGQLERISQHFEHSSSTLQEIQQHLEEGEYSSGGFNCSYPIFMGIYRAVSRISERGGQMVYLMLCTIVDTKGNNLVKGSKLDELSARLEEAIRTTIRRSDIMNHYAKGQYLVLLMNTTMENCEIIEKRINEKFMVNRQRINVKYYVNPVWEEQT